MSNRDLYKILKKSAKRFVVIEKHGLDDYYDIITKPIKRSEAEQVIAELVEKDEWQYSEFTKHALLEEV